MTEDGGISCKACQVIDHVCQNRCTDHHAVGNPGKICDERRDPAPWIDQRGPFIFDAVVIKPDCTDLDDHVLNRAETGRFYIQGDDRFIQKVTSLDPCC